MTQSSRTLQISFGVGMPSRDFTSEDLFSSRMMSMQSSTHSSQMNTVGPAMSLRTSCWLFPQNEQYSVFLESLVPTLPIPALTPDLKVDRANSVPEKTLTQLSTVRITVSRIPAILTQPTQPIMLTP